MTPQLQFWATIISAILGSSFLSTLLGNISGMKNIKSRLDDISYEIQSVRADASRRNIINFDKEIRRGVKHTYEDFMDIIKDIDAYDRFCQGHSSYPNMRCEEAKKHIKETFEEAQRKNDFLN